MTFWTEGSVTIFSIKAYLSAPSRSVHLSRITSTPSSTSSVARLSTHVSCAGEVQLYDTNTLGGAFFSSFPIGISTFNALGNRALGLCQRRPKGWKHG